MAMKNILSNNQPTSGYKTKRPLWQWVLIYLVIGGLIYGGVYYFMSLNKNGGYSNSTPTNTAQSTAPVATNLVDIKDMAFNPGAITVKKGTMVTWTNRDSAPHTVIETDGLTGPDSAYLNNGQTYSFTFNAVGTFHYHCSIHGFTGTVQVTE
jgi:plastocyanin